MNFYKVTGMIFIMLAGLIYTLERGFSIISTSIVTAGFYIGSMTGIIPKVEADNVFNFFVPLFLVLGVALVFYGFNKSRTSG